MHDTNFQSHVLALHQKLPGKISTKVSVPLENRQDLSYVYTPGVAEVAKAIAQTKEKVYDYTIKSHTVAVVSDGSAVLGLGNIGPEAALPVMEGKAVLFKTLADIDAFPICLSTQNTEEIIQIVKAIAPVFGGINLEDISAPRCFEIEDRLQNIGIPVVHDDQQGTAIVVFAGLINALKVAEKKLSEIKIVVLGAGAAGSAIAKLLSPMVKDILVLDSEGIISKERKNLHPYKEKLTVLTNKQNESGDLLKALKNADVFIGVSKANLFKPEYIAQMAHKPIIFAMANPIPEIMPQDAKKAGAFIVATGRSDFPNQINNSLAFPGIFKGLLQKRATRLTIEMKIRAAHALADAVTDPSVDNILPNSLDKKAVEAVSSAIV